MSVSWEVTVFIKKAFFTPKLFTGLANAIFPSIGAPRALFLQRLHIRVLVRTHMITVPLGYGLR